MANLKDIRRRILSVKGTQKITRAMKMVSAAKLRKAQNAAESFRPYAQAASEILSRVGEDAASAEHPLLKRREIRSSHILVISGERGLCGGFNSNLNRLVYAGIRGSDSRASLSVVGRKARQFFEFRGVMVSHFHDHVFDHLTYEKSAAIARELMALYRSGEVDSVEIASNRMISVVNQKPGLRRILPIVVPERRLEPGAHATTFDCEPDMNELLDELLPVYVESQVHNALLESVSAEHAARMTAMEAATNNAQEMIDGLTLEYNRARQSSITNELMDIVGGAEALSG